MSSPPEGTPYRDPSPQTLLIRDIPPAERPRERLRSTGARSLSTPELLAILLRVGRRNENAVSMATRLLTDGGGLKGLEQASFKDLTDLPGLGTAKIAQIKAALEMGRRLMQAGPDERPHIGGPEDVYDLVAGEMVFLEQEILRVLLLTTKNDVVGSVDVYSGTVNTAHLRVAEVFREAVRRNCPAIIVVHNHPSGDATPSSDDIQTTKQLIAAGKLLEIELVDHVVVAHAPGDKRFVSLKDQRLGFDAP